MAKEIKEELKTFKEKLDGKLSSITSSTGEIVSKINSLAQESTSTKSLVEANYQSSTGVNQAASKLASTAEFLGVISSDITSTVNGAVSKANSIIADVNKLESLLTEMESIQARINSESSKEKPNSGVISSERAKLSAKESEFDETQNKAITELTALKGMDKTVNVSGNNSSGSGTTPKEEKSEDTTSNESTLDTYSGYLKKLAYGTFTRQVFNSSYGKIDYYLYLPDKAESTPGLPVMLWLHGGSAHNTGMGSLTGYGLCPQIQNRQVTPNGIVILPHVKDFEGASGANARKAVVELTKSVVNKYKADTKRVSIAGASYGAITGYTIINENPGMFSAFVPISGWNKVTNEFKNVKVWAFHGARDNNGNRTTYKGALQALEQIKSMGGQATMTAFENMWHSNVQTKALTVNKSPDGKNENYLDWAMSQRRA